MQTVTVILPVRNESTSIALALRSVVNQTVMPDQIIIADGRSTDETRSIVREFPRGPVPLLLIDNPERTIPHGLNRAIAAATGDIIVRVDGHNSLPPDYIARCLAMLADERVWASGGAFRAYGRTAAGRAAAHAMHSPFGVGGGVGLLHRKRIGPVDGVPLGVFRRQVFERIGVFDTELALSEDDEFFQRIRNAGGVVLCDPSLAVSYLTRSSFTELFTKHLRWGVFKVAAIEKQPRLFRWRHAAPSGLVAVLATTAVITPIAFRPFLGVIGLWSAAASCAALRIRERSVPWPLIVCAFGTMHAGYGAGVLTGLARAAISRTRQRKVSAFPPEDNYGLTTHLR